MNRPAVVALSLTAACLALSCRFGAPREVRIGLLATFTGPFAEVSGIPTRQGAQLAVDEAGGTVQVGRHRYRITLVEGTFDDRADAAAAAARALINQQGVVALIGPQFSRHAIPVSLLAEDARVPMISPMSSNPATTAGRQYVFRLAFLDDVQGAVMALFATENLHARTAAVLYDVATAYSRDLAGRFRDAFVAHGGRVSAFESYTTDRMGDIDAQVRRVVAAHADVLFLPNFPDAVALQVQRLQAAGFRGTLVGSDSWDPIALPPLRGIRAFVTNQWRPDLPAEGARRFNSEFRRVYGVEPRATGALTYDAVRILLGALRRAGTLDPDSVRAAIAATAGYDGASGTITFAGRADPARSVAVSEIKDRSLETVRLVAPAPQP
jgi:branched-chain amino acid transport system substrate-binding protein